MTDSITIVGFGDSITAATTKLPNPGDRWLELLKVKLANHFPERSFNVINAGVGGNSARECMARFATNVVAHAPNYVLLEFGANNNDPAKLERRVSVPEFHKLLEKYKAELPWGCQTIVITFPPYFSVTHKENVAKYVKRAGEMEGALHRFREITKEFAANNGFPIYDFHKRLLEAGEIHGHDTYTLDDGVHLTKQGNVFLAEGVFNVLRQLITKETIR